MYLMTSVNIYQQGKEDGLNKKDDSLPNCLHETRKPA